MSKEIQERAKFNKIRYSNCWEDPLLLMEGLNINENSKILSIASAGDNSLSMLVKNPKFIVAADISIPQISLCDLKKNAIKFLDYDSFLSLLGFSPSENRVEIYKSIEEKLSLESRYYFQNNMSLIERGIIHQGKFEKYFQIFAKYIMPLVHNQKNLTELFLPKSIEAQKIFYDKVWNNFRFKLLFKVFFNKYVMGKLGRDKEFFKYVDVYNVAARIKKRADMALRNVATWNNPFLNYILLNNFEFSLPHYASEENFKIIKQNIDNLIIKTGTINSQAIEAKEKFNCYNLSDIFEYMGNDVFKQVAFELINSAQKGARLAYWNMLADRNICEVSDKVRTLDDLSSQLYEKDRAFFYKAFYIDEVLYE